MSEPLAIITAAPARRWFGIGTLVSLGVLLLIVSFAAQTGGASQFFLGACGLLSLGAAEWFRRLSRVAIIVTEEGFEDTLGRDICRIEDIKAVDRGALAFKPSNGFLLRLNVRKPRLWVPGLYWRLSRSVGVGGVTPAGQTKFVAELVAEKLARRQS